jgi:hypothetical protein
MPAVSVGETADIAGLAARSTAGDSSCTGTIFGNGTADLSHTPLRVCQRFAARCPRHMTLGNPTSAEAQSGQLQEFLGRKHTP